MEEFDVYRYIDIFRRRKISYFISVLILFGLTVLVVSNWSRYRSTATLQISQPTIPQGMAAPIGTDPSQLVQVLADQQIEQIERAVTSTASLVEIITKFNLYHEALKTAPIADVAVAMRKRIKVKLLESDFASPAVGSGSHSVGGAANEPPGLAFDLSFTYGDPLTAQRVTNELVTRFLDEDLNRRRAESHETVRLLERQIEDLGKEMAEQDAKISVLREKAPDSRPEALALNQQAMMTTFMNLQAVEAQLEEADRNRGNLRTQLASVEPYSRVISDGQVLTTPQVQLKALQAKYSTLAGQYAPDHPDVVKLRHQIESLQQEIGAATPDTAHLQAQVSDLRTNLAAATHTYGPDHPDVKALQRQLAATEDELARVPGPTSPQNAVKRDADNPAYVMLTAQLEALDQQYRSLQTQRDNLKKQYEQYQRNLVKTPATEREMAALLRDSDSAQLRYRELQEKRQSAQMSAEMEQDRLGARLSVVDQPALPTKTSPSRVMLFLAGTVFSLGGGLSGVVIREMLSRSVNGARDLTEIAGEPPLVVIPYIVTREERLKRRQRLRWILGGVVIALALAVLAFDQLVQPLDTLF